MPIRGVKEDDEQPSLSEVTDTVRSLVEVMRGNGLTELDITSGSVSIRLRAPKSGSGIKTHRGSDNFAAAPTPPSAEQHGHIVTAPMIGTFYASPTPGDPPYVRVGEFVNVGQTVGIIEAMKIMNEIISDRSGTVVDVIAANAQAVEYGSPLLRLDLSGDGDE